MKLNFKCKDISCFRVVLLSLLSMFSCTPPSSIGTDLFTEEAFALQVIDTVSIRLSTILLDSIDTYQPDRLLLGFHRDELLGKALAVPFFEVGLDNWNEGRPEKNTTSFDSITLVLTYDGYAAFDTTLQQTISVHRLRESMELPDDYSLYNTSTFAYLEPALGQGRFQPQPGSKSELEIRLSDQFGLDLFEKIRESDASTESESDFKSFFAGLLVQPDTTQNAAVLGFTNTPQLRLYYRDISTLPNEQRTITFSCDPTGDELLFNHIQGDRRQTSLAALQSGQQNTLDSRHSDNLSALQGGTGIQPRIELPYLRNLLESVEDFVIADAELTIRPILEKAADQFDLPQSLEVYWIDEDNQLTQQNPTPTVLNTDPEFAKEVFYQIDVRDFVEYLLETGENDGAALLLTFREEEYASSLRKVKFGNDQHPAAPMELSITLLVLK